MEMGHLGSLPYTHCCCLGLCKQGSIHYVPLSCHKSPNESHLRRKQKIQKDDSRLDAAMFVTILQEKSVWKSVKESLEKRTEI